MIQTMEKFINFKQLDVVKTGTSTSDLYSSLSIPPWEVKRTACISFGIDEDMLRNDYTSRS